MSLKMAMRIAIRSTSCCAAVRPAAALRFRFACANEGARNASLHRRCEPVDVQAALREERARVLEAVDAPRLHVDAVHLPGRSDSPGREQHVDAAARSQIEHRLSRLEL